MRSKKPHKTIDALPRPQLATEFGPDSGEKSLNLFTRGLRKFLSDAISIRIQRPQVATDQPVSRGAGYASLLQER